MMRYLLLLTTLVLLGACGATSDTSAPSPAPAPARDPVATATAALDALAAQDQATLLTLFDPAVGSLIGARVDAALDAWVSHQTLTRTQVPGALGPVLGQAVQPIESQGQT